MTKETKSIRCSSLPRLAACPGSLAASKGLSSPDNAASLEGTQCHLAMEAYYRSVEFDESRLTDSGSMRTRWFKKEMDALIESHGGADSVHTELSLEHQIPGTDIILTGHIDLVVICNDGTAIIADWKFGHLEVPHAAKNHQLYGYAWLFSMAAQTNVDFKFETIHAFIFSAGSQIAFTGVNCGKDVIANVTKFITTTATDALDPEATRKPCTEPCKYCQAAGTDACPESKELVQQNAVGLELMQVKAAGLPADKDEVVKIFEAIKQVASIGEKFLARLKEEVEADPEKWAQHFWLKPGNKARKILDVQGVYEKVVDGADLVSSEAFLGCVGMSITKLGVLLKEPLKDAGIAAGKQKDYITEMLGDLIDESQNEPSIKLVN